MKPLGNLYRVKVRGTLFETREIAPFQLPTVSLACKQSM